LAAPAAAVVWVLARLWRRRWRDDGAVLGLLAAAGLWAVLVPHPLVPADGVLMRDDAAAPPLWTDAAYWHFHAPQQELAFRDRPASTVFDDAAAAASETWLVLGGSVTFGWETAATTTFTALAEQQLAGEGYRVRLLNAGVGGWNLGQLDRFLRDVGDRMPLHGVVLISVLNNAAFRIVGPPTAPPCGTLLCAYAYNLSRNYLLLPVANYFLPKPNNLARYETLLDDIVSRERALGRIVVLIDETHEAQLHPAWYNRWIGGVQDRYRAVARAVAAAQGLQFHRVDDAVAQVPVDQRFTDGMHLTSAGHAAVAARLADILRPYLGTDAGR
jgi:lysophospholipase L1-like esterase